MLPISNKKTLIDCFDLFTAKEELRQMIIKFLMKKLRKKEK